MKNPFLNLDSNENLVSNSNYLNKDDVFLSIKEGVRFLNNEDISKAKSIFIDQEDTISSNPKFQKIKDLNKYYIEWIDEYYGIKHSDFDNIFITGTNGKTSTVDFLSQIFKYNGLDYSSSGTLAKTRSVKSGAISGSIALIPSESSISIILSPRSSTFPA